MTELDLKRIHAVTVAEDNATNNWSKNYLTVLLAQIKRGIEQ